MELNQTPSHNKTGSVHPQCNLEFMVEQPRGDQGAPDGMPNWLAQLVTRVVTNTKL